MSDYIKTGWLAKVKSAFGGIAKGIKGENSFYVHIPMALTVVALAWLLDLDWIRFSVLLLCIGVVLACELFNSSIERLAKAITRDFDRHVGDALDIASGAVLVASVFAALVGLVILLPPLLSLVAPG